MIRLLSIITAGFALLLFLSSCTVRGFKPEFHLMITGFQSMAEMKRVAALTAFEVTGYTFTRYDTRPSHSTAITIVGRATEGEFKLYFDLNRDLTLHVQGGDNTRAEDDVEMAWIRATVLTALPEHLVVRQHLYGVAGTPDVTPERPTELPARERDLLKE